MQEGHDAVALSRVWGAVMQLSAIEAECVTCNGEPRRLVLTQEGTAIDAAKETNQGEPSWYLSRCMLATDESESLICNEPQETPEDDGHSSRKAAFTTLHN